MEKNHPSLNFKRLTLGISSAMGKDIMNQKSGEMKDGDYLTNNERLKMIKKFINWLFCTTFKGENVDAFKAKQFLKFEREYQRALYNNVRYMELNSEDIKYLSKEVNERIPAWYIVNSLIPKECALLMWERLRMEIGNKLR